MADRQSAYLFAEIFALLAEDPITESDLKKAQLFYEQTRDYDFSTYQMYCDEELIKLGLAKRGPDPEWAGKTRILYLGKDYE